MNNMNYTINSLRWPAYANESNISIQLDMFLGRTCEMWCQGLQKFEGKKGRLFIIDNKS